MGFFPPDLRCVLTAFSCPVGALKVLYGREIPVFPPQCGARGLTHPCGAVQGQMRSLSAHSLSSCTQGPRGMAPLYPLPGSVLWFRAATASLWVLGTPKVPEIQGSDLRGGCWEEAD